ncbi:B-4DMT family transporter [Solihabitans fulvus]|uniref:B-4DMT family transporter n=1 Tax=Solihabitans fulvus TaxID=1892852 RepID=UPI001661F746|nr:B-4DMT family transporter [Solihabitans fulvus]
MRAWVVRGICLAVVHAATQTVLAAVQVRAPESASVLDPVGLGLVAVVALLWGVADGWRRLPDRGMAWFLAGLVAGPLAGLLGVLARSLFVDQTGLEALGAALTGGAAFTALLVMVPGALGGAIGQLLRTSASTDAEAEENDLDDDTPDRRGEHNQGEHDPGDLERNDLNRDEAAGVGRVARGSHARGRLGRQLRSDARSGPLA